MANESYPTGSWVQNKSNTSLIRFITKPTDNLHFEDDGKVSGAEPFKYCRYLSYKIIPAPDGK